MWLSFDILRLNHWAYVSIPQVISQRNIITFSMALSSLEPMWLIKNAPYGLCGLDFKDIQGWGLAQCLRRLPPEWRAVIQVGAHMTDCSWPHVPLASEGPMPSWGLCTHVVCACTHTYAHTATCTWTHMHASTLIDTYIYIHTCTHTHTHTGIHRN